MIGRRRRAKSGKGDTATADDGQVPGKVQNLVSNLLLADVVIGIGTTILHHAVERGSNRQLDGKDRGKKSRGKRSVGQTLVLGAATKIASRSMPGAILVGGGILAKTLFDRNKARRMAQQLTQQERLDED